MSSGLFLELALGLGVAPDGFLLGNARLGNLHRDVVPYLEPVHEHVQSHTARPREWIGKPSGKRFPGAKFVTSDRSIALRMFSSVGTRLRDFKSSVAMTC